MSGSRKIVDQYIRPSGIVVTVWNDGSSSEQYPDSLVVRTFDVANAENGYYGTPIYDPLYSQQELARLGCSSGWEADVAHSQGCDPTGLDQHAKGAKLDAGKLRWHLLPMSVIEGVVRIMTFGAEKYTEDGWKEVPQGIDRYFSAMMRHWAAIKKGETTDPESGLPHYYHFMCNAMFLTWFLEQADQKEYDQDDA